MGIKLAAALTGALGLSACNGPSPRFRGVPAETVTVGESVFEVRRMGPSVELLRTNAQYAPTLASIIPSASHAVFIATGCLPVPASWKGEQTLMQVDLDCSDS